MYSKIDSVIINLNLNYINPTELRYEYCQYVNYADVMNFIEVNFKSISESFSKDHNINNIIGYMLCKIDKSKEILNSEFSTYFNYNNQNYVNNQNQI